MDEKKMCAIDNPIQPFRCPSQDTYTRAYSRRIRAELGHSVSVISLFYCVIIDARTRGGFPPRRRKMPSSSSVSARFRRSCAAAVHPFMGTALCFALTIVRPWNAVSPAYRTARWSGIPLPIQRGNRVRRWKFLNFKFPFRFSQFRPCLLPTKPPRGLRRR